MGSTVQFELLGQRFDSFPTGRRVLVEVAHRSARELERFRQLFTGDAVGWRLFRTLECRMHVDLQTRFRCIKAKLQ